MPARLFVIHGSHPCTTVELALELKGVAFTRVELPYGMQGLVMKPLFGGRTVPGIRFEDGARVQGSRAILRALEERVPEPALYGDGARGEKIADAERWGDEVLQPIPRRLLVPAFRSRPDAMHAFQEGQKTPKLPLAVVKAVAPSLLAVAGRLNGVTEESTREDLRRLPECLDRVDAWMADGLVGGDQPNAADLQIAPSLRLLWAIADVRPLIAGRPCEALAWKWLSPMPAEVPAGALPAAIAEPR